MSDVETLRAAARILREHADQATQGMWLADEADAAEHVVEANRVLPNTGTRTEPVAGDLTRSDAAFIALMGPDLARDLARWLEREAWFAERGAVADPAALAVARRVTGGGA